MKQKIVEFCGVVLTNRNPRSPLDNLKSPQPPANLQEKKFINFSKKFVSENKYKSSIGKLEKPSSVNAKKRVDALT